MQNIKSIAKRVPVLGPAAIWLNSRIKETWKLDPAYWIERLAGTHGIQVVQIGSNDGKTGDPLFDLFQRHPSWKGLFVEPVPFIFERLKKNHTDETRFRFENTLINDGETVRFYWIDESAKQLIPDLPDWYDQLGSFNRSHITKHLPQCEPFIRDTDITGMTLMDLLQKHEIDHVDLLHIDTEGADYKILSQIDLEKTQPGIILFERKHLNEEEHAAAVRLLEAVYHLFNMGDDILAVRQSADPSVISTTRSLKKFRMTVAQPR